MFTPMGFGLCLELVRLQLRLRYQFFKLVLVITDMFLVIFHCSVDQKKSRFPNYQRIHNESSHIPNEFEIVTLLQRVLCCRYLGDRETHLPFTRSHRGELQIR